MAKNIVILADGTGQEGGKGHDTNIYKLFRLLEDRTENQVVFYDEGLGTDWHKFTGNAFGAGFSRNVLQCYQFVFDNYNAGDKIFLFGFSRGAATVRSLASFIHFFGILPKTRAELIKRAYRLYKKGHQIKSNILRRKDLGDSRMLNDRARRFVHEHPNQWADIEFLGVFDTVPALGVVALAGLNTILGKILNYDFHDFKLHPSVKNAYHALSIDDDRLWFHPSLWTEKAREEQIIEQVWFSGSHTDIGGGYMEPGLSDITLEWMVEKAVSHGLRIYLGSRKYWNFVVAPDPTDQFHYPRKGLGKIYKQTPRNTIFKDPHPGRTMRLKRDHAALGAPIIHQSVMQRIIDDRESKEPRPGDLQGASPTKLQLLFAFAKKVFPFAQPSLSKKYLPWIFEKTNACPVDEPDENFKQFLHHKFYESLKFEWKKYDWINEKYQTQKFEDWMKIHHKDYLESYEWQFEKVHKEDGYKEYCLKNFGKGKLQSRKEWLTKNPFVTGRRDPDWLESYQPYKDWLIDHRVEYNGKVYYVEPARMLYEYRTADGRTLYLTEADAQKINLKENKVEKLIREIEIPKGLRDYDEETLRKILKLAMDAQGHKKQFEEKMNEIYDELLKRSHDERKNYNRLDYDLKRKHPDKTIWLDES